MTDLTDGIATQVGTLETAKDAGKPPQGIVARWLMEWELADKIEKDWRTDATEAIKIYRNDGRTLDDNWQSRRGRFNILWANVETLKPAVYSAVPKPVVTRRYKDADPVGREVARVIERAIAFLTDSYDFDGVMKQTTNDVLLPGRGQAWERYKPTYGEDGSVAYETVECEHVDWRAFRHGGARVWDDVTWVGREHQMTKDELVRRFGKVGNDVPLDQVPDKLDSDRRDDYGVLELFKTARVYEIWDKDKRQVLFIAPSYKDAPLLTVPDPLKLQGFFPCPKPAYSIETTDSLVPITEYSLYADQARELDRVTQRITLIVEAIRARGIYDGTITELAELMRADDTDLVPAQNIAALRDVGGLDKAIYMLPLDEYARILVGLYQQREQIKTIIYEITGLSDIIRGSSVASETATAQKIKDKYGSLRIQSRQKEIARFARDLFRIKAEIIAEHFSPQTLTLMTGIQVTPEMMALMKSDLQRGFRIEVETDSTIALDEQAEKEAVTEFLTAMGQVVSQMAEPVKEGYMPAAVAKQILMFAVRRFRAGRDIEGAIEAMPDQAPPQQDGEAQAAQQQMQMEMQQKQAEMQMDAQKAQADAALETQKAMAEFQLEQSKAAFDAQMQTKEAEAKQREAILQAQIDVQVAQIKADTEIRIAEMKLAAEKEMKAQELSAQAELAANDVSRDIEMLGKQAESAGDGKTTAALTELVKRISQPKRVIRDQAGRVAGVEPAPGGV